MKKYSFNLFILWLIVLSFLPLQTFAAESKTTFSQAELDQMLAPIALYPDSLLSQILMASTYPGNVAEAVRWSKGNPKQQGDAAVKAVQNKSWDPSVMSLVAFPQVLEMMGKKPDWVQNLGDAFLANSETVMSSIQNLRQKAKEEGNLETSSEQNIIIEADSSPEIIVIQPADPEIVYVPTYNPTTIYGPWWYPAYPPYYYHPVGTALVAGITFGIGVGIVNSLWGGCNWRRGDVDIDINRHNDINIDKNKIDAGKNRSDWKHNSNNRTAPYRDKTNREKFSNKRGGADKRQDFRGRDSNKTGRSEPGNKNTRDADRKKAEASLKNHGVDPAKARKNLSGSGGDNIRNQVSNIDRNRGDNLNRGGLSNSGSSRDRAKTSNFSQNRSKNTSSNHSRSSSLSGISNKSSTANNFNRGSYSRSSFSGGGGGRRGGGGGRR